MLRLVQILIISIALIIGLLNIPILSQNQNIKNYTPQNGLPDSKVLSITQDKAGMIWLACASGIYSYDANKFTAHGEQDGIPNREYKILKTDSLGRVFAFPYNLKDDIVYLDGGTWKKIEITNELDSSLLNTGEVIIRNNSIVILLTSKENFHLFENGQWINYSKKNKFKDLEIYDIDVFKNKLFLSTQKGLIEVVNDSLCNRFNPHSVSLSKSIFTTYIESTGKPNVTDEPRSWMLGQDWLGYIDKGIFTPVSNEIRIPLNLRFNCLLSSDSGKNIFFGSSPRLYSYNISTKTFKLLNKKDGFVSFGATSIFVDREKNTWITSLRGITKIKQSPFVNYFETNGLLENEVTAIEKFKNGAIILGHNEGLTVFRDNHFEKIKFNERITSPAMTPRILDFFNDSDKYIWFAAQLNGIGKLDRNYNLKWFRNEDNLVCNSILRNNDDHILVGTDEGIYNIENGRLTKAHGFENIKFWTRKLFLLDNGTLVICGPMGILLKNSKELIKIKSEDRNSADTYSVYKNSNNEILAGTRSGLYIIRGDTLVKFVGKNNFTIDRPVYFIKQDSLGNIWFGLDNGVIKWDGINYKKFTESDGLAGFETNRSAAYTEADGKFWIGTNNGLSCYIPGFVDTATLKPLVNLLFVEDASGRQFSLSHLNNFAFDQNDLTFHYRGLSFIDESKNKFHLYLKNISVDSKNEYITSEIKVRFSNLAPGQYVFSVALENSKGILSAAVKSGIAIM